MAILPPCGAHLVAGVYIKTKKTKRHNTSNVSGLFPCFWTQVKLVNIRNDDITDGNPKLTLGLIWTIILHFQVSALIAVFEVVKSMSHIHTCFSHLVCCFLLLVIDYCAMTKNNNVTVHIVPLL